MRAKALAPWVLALAMVGAGCRASPEAEPETAKARLGLMTSLPIYWAEAHDVGEMLQAGEQPAQVRQALETRFVLEPLDTLEAETLRGHRLLLLAQPRPLTPLENVALDRWVREGGRVLVFADPMLTRHSHFGVGDKRRAQDVVLLSPILKHWGLELSFDPAQSPPERRVDIAGAQVPVSLAGTLSALPGGNCDVSSKAILASCQIGRGTVTVLADAAVLDDAEDGDSQQRSDAILRLSSLAFD